MTCPLPHQTLLFQWLGVNLGGWLLLERGPSEPFFEDQNAPGDEEWAFCQLMRQRGHAEEVFEAHRSKHFVEDDIVRMKALGLNAVRVPFGYWCVTGPTEGDAYVGPCLHHLDNVVAWCEKHGLQVNKTEKKRGKDNSTSLKFSAIVFALTHTHPCSPLLHHYFGFALLFFREGFRLSVFLPC